MQLVLSEVSDNAPTSLQSIKLMAQYLANTSESSKARTRLKSYILLFFCSMTSAEESPAPVILPQKEVNLSEVDGFVQKPFSPDALNAQVKKIIG